MLARTRRLPALAATFALALGAAACSSPSPGGDAGDAGGDAQTSQRPMCTVRLSATGDFQTAVQTALIDATSGSVICFEDGVYAFTRPLSLAARNVTLQGAADGAILDFGGQSMGDASMTVTGDGFTLQHLAIRNARANGVRVDGVDGVTFRHVHAFWEGGPSMANGAYALYPVSSNHVLIEDCEVEGAADAGIYVGQSRNVVVRRNRVHGNVTGIEIENCSDSCVYENEAYDNTAGILVFTLPGLPFTGEGRAKVHHNRVRENNRANFCHGGAIVCEVPPGVGMMVMAADHTEIHDNTITSNNTAGVLLVDFRIVNGMFPMTYDPTPDDTFIHDNTFMSNGGMPTGMLATLAGETVADIVRGTSMLPCENNTMGRMCMGNNGNATFFCADVTTLATSRVATPHECTATAQSCVSF